MPQMSTINHNPKSDISSPHLKSSRFYPFENLIYRYSSQFGTFLHQDREKLRSSTREYVLYVSW
jgi:hypothetical protein